jgi:hypothetical protein
MIALNNTDQLVRRSARLAESLLQESLPERWQHTLAVAHRATELASFVLPADRRPDLRRPNRRTMGAEP